MVASTDIKFYVHSNNNAPQLQNAYGSMIGVLDACLVNGISLGIVSTLTAVGTTVTAVFSTAHNLMQYQVIKIVGANQAEYNGEHRILTVPNATSVTFQLVSAPSVTTATGSITASLPSLGWEKPFSSTNEAGGGKAAYRSKNTLLPSRPFLRVVDELDPAYTATYAKFAKVGMVEDMTDINTMLGVQAPYDSASVDKNWVGTGTGTAVINGWAKWYYARNTAATGTGPDTSVPANGIRKWLLIGDDDHFYLIPAHTVSNDFGPVYGFGKFNSNISSDSANTYLSATINNAVASSSFYAAGNTGIGSNLNRNACIIIQRKYDQSAVFATASNGIMSISTSNTSTTGSSDVISSLATLGFSQSCDVHLTENTTNFSSLVSLIRGKFAGLQWLFQSKPFAELQLEVLAGEIWLAKNVATSTAEGQMLFKVGDL
ncbi:hypothetical protein [Acinetobacter sp. SWAC57]|uniref:hypothetical protein n=1 Tax=Acinetobacter sp. SWAC57 TaxID=2293834 RepID=UPI000E5BE5BA|nr:hypothetical protein [Acinetobacter sp. SWAC57]RGD93360.1 hypothetical protein DYI96_00525 [Acinetobacter sp. SWAC57]